MQREVMSRLSNIERKIATAQDSADNERKECKAQTERLSNVEKTLGN